MSRGATLLASLLVTIGRPEWWQLALAAFLVRGGFVLFLLPIVVLPSPLGLSNAVAPFIVPIALGRVGPEAVAVILGLVAVVVAWLILGGLAGAATDEALAREAAAEAIDEGVGPAAGVARPADDGLAWRVLAARLAAAVPLAVAVGAAIVAVVAVAYAELTRPDDTSTPLAVRVAVGAAANLAVVVLAWVVAEVVGGTAARRIALDGATTRGALAGAARDLVRRPSSILIPWLATTLALGAGLAVMLVAASIAWQTLQRAIATPTTEPLVVAATLLAFVAIWLAGLVVAGLLAAVRSAAAAFEHVRSGVAVVTGPGSADPSG